MLSKLTEHLYLASHLATSLKDTPILAASTNWADLVSRELLTSSSLRYCSMPSSRGFLYLNNQHQNQQQNPATMIFFRLFPMPRWWNNALSTKFVPISQLRWTLICLFKYKWCVKSATAMIPCCLNCEAHLESLWWVYPVPVLYCYGNMFSYQLKSLKETVYRQLTIR